MKSHIKRLFFAGLPLPRCILPFVRAMYRAGVFTVESCTFLRKLFWIEPVLRSVCEHVGAGLRAERLPYMRGEGRIVIGDRVNLSGRSCLYFMGGMTKKPLIIIGDDSFVGNACTLSCAREIRVGRHCLISALVRIHDNDGHPLDPDRRRRNEPIQPDEAAAVVIEDNVWIGAGATILKGVRIGENSVVGTGAVVTADVPPHTVVAGNPARTVKALSTDSSPSFPVSS